MNDLERLLRERARAMQATQNKRLTESQLEALRKQQEQQERENEKRQKTIQIADEYRAIQDIVVHTGIESSLQRILEFSVREKSYRGRDLNIPSKFIPRPRYHRNQGGYTKVDYHRMIDKPFLFPYPLQAGQVIDDATRLTRDPKEYMRSIQNDPETHLWSHLEWTSCLYWVVYNGVHYYSIPMGMGSSSGSLIHIFEKGLIVTATQDQIEIAQYRNDGNGTIKDGPVIFKDHSLYDANTIDLALADAFAGTLKESY